jgi:SAM-dependent methyltransferase
MAHNHNHNHGLNGRGDLAEIDAMADLVDLDAEVLHAYLTEVTDWVRHEAGDGPHQLIVDLGCGTGPATIALARRFDPADVLAVDQSEPMLARVKAKATDLGLTDRIHPLAVDLDADWPITEPVDVVWASLSMHHFADPDRVLRDIFAALRPGGLLALVEMESPPRFLPDDIGRGRPGLERRCQDAMRATLADALPRLGSDWGPPLAEAGFTVTAERIFAVDPARPYPAAVGRYAQAYLRRVRSGLDGQLADDDRATLDTLLADDGPDCLRNRTDLDVRGTRTVWLARRPQRADRNAIDTVVP